MPPLPQDSLIARVAAALAEPDADYGLNEALIVLASAGIVSRTRSDGTPWLEIQHGGRRLALDAATPPPTDEVRKTLHDLLSSGIFRALSEDALRQARERMDMLSAASFEGIFIHENGVVIDANQRFAEILGYTGDDALGPDTMRACVAPEDMPSVLERMQSRFEGAYVITGIRKDASRFRAELQSKQGKLGGRPVRVVAVRDVTERERTAALLHESESRLRDLAQEAFDFIVFSRDGIALEIVGSLERVLGYEPKSWIGRPLLDFVAPSSVPLAARVLAEQRTGSYEIVVVSATGEHVPVAIVGLTSTLRGEPVRVGAVRDLRQVRRLADERRQLEAQLQRSQRLESLGVLAGGVAHDFNNLLVGVLGNAEILRDGLAGADDRELCDSIIAAARRAADLTAQLLAYAGQRDLGRRGPVDLGTLWREISSAIEPRLARNARIELSLGPGSVVLGDRATLTQVLMNLLTNASDALSGSGGAIHVTTSRVSQPDARWDHALGAAVGPGDWVQLEVTDTGVGMDPATLHRVFEPFFSTKDKGHGLGLASCLGIVAAHGGALSVESVPGRGTRFSVLLPATQLSTSERAPRPSKAKLYPAKILVIDDESVVRALLRRSLERRGYTVVEAVDGESGIRAVHAAEPDLVVLDMTMPDVDGAEVVRRVRADGLRVPIVIASGHLDSAMESRLARGSFQAFLHKPFSVAELMTTIEAALDLAHTPNR